MRLLHLCGNQLQVRRQNQRLPQFPAHDSFCPQLVAFLVQVLEHILFPFNDVNIHRPPPPSASGIIETLLAVGGAEKHTLPIMLRGKLSVRCPVVVFGFCQEHFDRVYVGLRHCLHLRDFVYPRSLNGFHSVLVAECAQAVTEPDSAHFGENRGLKPALCAYQNRHCVVFTARTHDAGHRARE